MTETTLVILGASGDLTRRLLLPGLGSLLGVDTERQLRIIGASRGGMPESDWREQVAECLRAGGAEAGLAESIGTASTFVALDVLQESAWTDFVAQLPADTVLYSALPPTVSVKACHSLHGTELPDGLRLALEKPFGYDLASAREFNATLSRLVPEHQVFRVDHFLGMSTVLNLLGLRFTNRILAPVWSAEHIERVEIVFDESLGLEGRAGYYDAAGALLDMIQSHLMSVMALTAMERPQAIGDPDLRDRIADVLQDTRVWRGEPREAARRARYTAGQIGDRKLPDYTAEPGVDPQRKTETLAEVALEVRSARWQDVPFVLRSGKGLGDGADHVRVHFRPVSRQPEGFTDTAVPNSLTIGLVPARLHVTVSTNGAGDKYSLETTDLAAELGDSPTDAYGQILGGILDGDPLLSVRGDIAEECWRIVTPLIEAFRDDDVPLEEYPAGSAGPRQWTERPLAAASGRGTP